jgi:hypothetical protein
MVKGNVANELGDKIIISLIEPYNGVARVLGYEIMAGVRGNLTPGKVTIEAFSNRVTGYRTRFNTSFNDGDKIIIGNIEYEIDTVNDDNTIILTTTPMVSGELVNYYKPVNINNYLSYEFRWSQSNDQFSEFRELNLNTTFNDLLTLDFDHLKPFWIDIRGTIEALSTANEIHILSITFSLETQDGLIEACPQFCGVCDPYVSVGCANIRVDCVLPENIFKPYALNKPDNVYKQLNMMVNDIFGHQTRYYRTEPDQRTKDVILMEYSLYNVVDEGLINILVPGNTMPTREFNYNIFGMEFDDFEVHIVDEHFQNVFGNKKSPRAKDYLFFPLINRVYEIVSVSLADEFNMNTTYWRVMLRKYENHSATIKNTQDEMLSDLIVSVDDIFGEEIQNEFEKVTKPQQYRTVNKQYADGVRIFTNKNIKIVDETINNRWTMVSRNCYNLTEVDANIDAVVYSAPANLIASDSLAFTAWFKPKFPITDTTDYYLINGSYVNTGFDVILNSSTVKININGIQYTHAHGIILDQQAWYSIIVNINNEFSELSVYIYKLYRQDNYTTPQAADNSLQLMLKWVTPISQLAVWTTNDSMYRLVGTKFWLTNIRIFNRIIEEEQHSNVLNQYVVRDSDKVIVTDNAIPSSTLVKLKNAR